ncbi:3-hydroxyacyl-CoA dehydrogenase NAD-binding domain-containing protein [Brevundimonas sp.]|uniref:3-hydroxyacyl-CoA dehydrogenase NAD-binding domain-containing protein n=1 Tax=Brevundimonas sp. TaxID=1871086 RepID=UPI002899F68C|nr:3-hydroxyacyl-CoA dehydrogenase NAD-binding domain-containing protein [Brevundimonas sp.]
MLDTHIDGDILVITLKNPPVNALGKGVRDGLAKAIEDAATNDAIKAVVIHGEGRGFSGGADITEFGGGGVGSVPLPVLIDRLEASAKPVVAAIHGTAFGGGLELALGAHYRVAAPSAKLGLPEVKLGILPGAGGTQRLPRVIGVEAALPMIVSGDPINAKKAEGLGLVDKIAGEDTFVADAIAFAREVAGRDTHPRTSEREDKLEAARKDPEVFDRFKKEHGRRLAGLDAPVACVAAVKAAVELPFEQGIAKERELFGKLLMGGQSKALRHNFFAERAANKIDGLAADTPIIPIKKVGILGAGTMGGGIAMNFLNASIPVTILERDQAPLDRGLAVIEKNYRRMADRGRITHEMVDKAMSLLSPTLSYNDLADCDLVIEAVFENMDVKKEVFRTLDKTVKAGAILASNTSYLNIDEMAAETGRPESVLGLHFFSPANVMRLLEIVRGAKTSDSVLATAMALSRKIGKVAVVSGVCPGFIGNRMLSPRQREAQKLMMDGAKPWDIDRVLTEFGFPMGPFQMNDLAGLDLGWNKEKSKGENVRDVLCERDRRGQKTGKGYYDYDENRRATPSAEVEEIINAFIVKSGKTPRQVGDEEIRDRLLYSMINEGAKILDEGIAQRASDIDVVWLNGYGWPIATGGPMFWADSVGLDKVLAGLEKYSEQLGKDFVISPLLRKKAAAGETFN